MPSKATLDKIHEIKYGGSMVTELSGKNAEYKCDIIAFEAKPKIMPSRLS